jgi:hypothetical protein
MKRLARWISESAPTRLNRSSLAIVGCWHQSECERSKSDSI